MNEQEYWALQVSRFTWVTKDGRYYRPAELGNTHLLNIIRQLDRQIDEVKDVVRSAACYEGVHAAGAMWGCDQAVREGEDLLDRLYHALGVMGFEAKRRGLLNDR